MKKRNRPNPSLGSKRSAKSRKPPKSPPQILRRDRNGYLHDASGHFVPAPVYATAYSLSARGQMQAPSGKRVTKHEAERIRKRVSRAAVAAKKESKVAKARREALRREIKAVREARKPARVRRKIREKYPRQRRKRLGKRVVEIKPKAPRIRGGGTRNWRDKIRLSLERCRAVTGLEGKIHVVRNADGSVDGELRLQVAGSGIEAREVIKTLSEFGDIPNRTWFAVGARYNPREFSNDVRQRYILWQNMTDVVPSYGWSSDRGEMFATALTMVDDMHEAHGVGVKEIVVRINWNGADDRPERVGEK